MMTSCPSGSVANDQDGGEGGVGVIDMLVMPSRPAAEGESVNGNKGLVTSLSASSISSSDALQ